jgi:thioredoxin 1
MRPRFLISLMLCVAAIEPTLCFAQSANAFPPLDQWKSAVLAGNAATLRSLYSSSPPAQISASSTQLTADSEISFWTGFKAKNIDLRIAQSNAPQPGLQQIVFQARIRILTRTLYVTEAQLWQQQGLQWKLLSAKRTDATKLEQPLSLDAKIYPVGGDTREEIRTAVARAAKSRKHVLLIFGADWCYDCHVLDKAFHRQDVAAVLTPNYEVVHVDVGEGDKNQDPMNQYDVPMKRGIPAIAVLDARGKLLYSQKNGEFERARALGPEDLLDFLKKWKPQAR